MEINIEKQKNLLEVLGAIDGQLSAINITQENLLLETEKLASDKKIALAACQHIDEEGNPALAGGVLYTWCQICGTLLTEEDLNELEKLEK
jgi:hypothetical protein